MVLLEHLIDRLLLIILDVNWGCLKLELQDNCTIHSYKMDSESYVPDQDQDDELCANVSITCSNLMFVLISYIYMYRQNEVMARPFSVEITV